MLWYTSVTQNQKNIKDNLVIQCLMQILWNIQKDINRLGRSIERDFFAKIYTKFIPIC